MGSDEQCDDVALLSQLASLRERLVAEVGRVVVGQSDALDGLLVALLAEGHAILVGVPGLAKTLLVRTLGGLLKLPVGRIQFTPDLMPADILGSEMLHQNKPQSLAFVPGPIFTGLLLADEINRTSPKTQAALLEAMQERQVTVAGQCYPLPRPFCVIATRNPIELEGTYPLPEAQLDRFLVSVPLNYPKTLADEVAIARLVASLAAPQTIPLVDAAAILAFQSLVRRLPVAERFVEQIASLVRRSRPTDPHAPPLVQRYVRWGVSPRGTQSWLIAAKAHAALRGQATVQREDIAAVAPNVLRHRLVLDVAAELDDRTPDDIVTELLSGL